MSIWHRLFRGRSPAERARDAHWNHVNIYDGVDAFLRTFATVPEAIRPLIATQWVHSEVHNGGFAQLFFNSTGVVVPEAISGYRALGLPALADVISAATRIFPQPYPRDRDERLALFELSNHEDPLLAHQQFAERTAAQLQMLDEAFWQVSGSEKGGYEAAADRYAEGLK